MDGDSKPSTQDAVDSIVLEEEIDPNYVPSEPEVVEYAKWMGMDLDKDQDLFWIAREGLMAPLPKDWKPCRTKDTEDIYYFNFSTGDSTWDHPCDGYYKRLYEEEKKKKETVIKESGDQNRSKAKQDVEQLLGKADKKKSKKVPRTLSDIDMVKALPAPLTLQKAPLPGISNPLRMSAPSSLGPLTSAGGSSGDGLSSISKGSNLLRKSDSDMKVSSSLEAPRLISSRDPSPLGRFPVDSADAKPLTLTARQRVELKEKEDDARNSENEVERSMGRLDVTSSLSSKSRVLGGGGAGSTSGATSKLRAALPGLGERRDDDWRNAPSEDKPVHDDGFDHKPLQEKPEPPTQVVRLPRSSPPPADVSVASAAPHSEDTYYKDKCAELERRAEEHEARVADYKASYNAAKEDLSALERRYEVNQSQWVDRVRALEVEKDKVESERRQLKLALLDLESVPPKAVQVSQAVDNAAKFENERLQKEIVELKLKVQSTETALVRSTATHAELQLHLQDVEAAAQVRIEQAQTQRDATLVESAKLVGQLEECTRLLNEARQAVVPVPVQSVPVLRSDENALSAVQESEIQSLRTLLETEQNRCSDALAQLLSVGGASEEKSRTNEDQISALQQQLASALATISSTRSELEEYRTEQSISNRSLVVRAEAAESQLLAAELTISELRVVEVSLRSEVSDKDRKLSDQQEQMLALQAANNLSTSSDNEKNAQFEVFVSQATAIRKSLKSEIERQKAQLLDLESEKSSLVTQLTRQEATLQFAKKELNGVASLTELNRQADSEKQQLAVQLDSVRATSARQAEQEFQLREKYEQLLQQLHEEEDLRRALRQENERLVLTLEQERTSETQSEKKIKSYQEELLQLQRRLAEKSSPQKASRVVEDLAIHSTSPVPSPTHSISDDSAVVDLRRQLLLKQEELDRVTLQLAERDTQLLHSQEQERLSKQNLAALNVTVATLQDQLRAAALELSDLGADKMSLHSASMREKDQLEMERMHFDSQLKGVRSLLASSQASLELASSNVQRHEVEVKTYRDKWLASEKELMEARLALSAGAAGSDVAVGALQLELREAQAASQHSKATEDSLRSQLAATKKALDDQGLIIRDLRADAVRVVAPSENKENLQRGQIVVDSPPVMESSKVPQDARPNQSSNNQQHIVALSLEVGRQQATMERLEQHIRNTEVVLQEIKSQGNKKGNSGTTTPTSQVTRQLRLEETAWESSTPDSQQSLLAGHAENSGSSPARRARSRQQEKAAKSVQFQFPGKERDRKRVKAAAALTEELLDLVDIKDRIVALVEEMDMDVHDGTTLKGLTSARGSELTHLVNSTAQRVLIEGKARLRKETKFLKEVQIICLSAKEAINHNQECVKNLKAAWRSAKSDQPGTNMSGITTESVNSVTLKVNSAVDELREMQQLTKAREGRMKSLHQSIDYLEQLEGGTGKAEAHHLVEIMQLVQQKCLESASDLEALVTAYRSKGRPTATVSHSRSHKSNTSTVPLTQGVAFSAAELGRREDRVDAVANEHASRRFETPSLPASAFDPRYQAAHVQHPPSPPHSRLIFSSLPIPTYGMAPPSMSTSLSVSGMRNSDLKNRLLQEQIAKITERQSISKAVCEKHAGWLSDLGKEISGAAHGGNAASSNRSAACDSFAASLQAHKTKYATSYDEATTGHSRTFGTALQNQKLQLPSETVDVLLQNL